MDLASFKSEAYTLPLNKSVTVRLNAILWRHLLFNGAAEQHRRQFGDAISGHQSPARVWC